MVMSILKDPPRMSSPPTSPKAPQQSCPSDILCGSKSLNSILPYSKLLKGRYLGDYVGDYYKGY